MDRELAILSLREIIMRALGAIEQWAAVKQHTGTSLDFGHIQGWDLEFACMSRKDQVDWLISLFSALTNDEIESIDEVLCKQTSA